MKAVVTLGKYFGPKHPRKGQETGFIAKVADGRIERLIKRAEREQKYLLTVKHE